MGEHLCGSVGLVQFLFLCLVMIGHWCDCGLRRHDVIGVFMRNWDETEEKGNDNCSVEADYAQAQSVCRHIGIPLHEADFVRQYWTHVFSDFIAQVRFCNA